MFLGGMNVLSDRPRKLLIILFHWIRINGRPPTLDELIRRTNWRKSQIRMSLQILAVGGYIEWREDDHSKLKVLRPFVLETKSASIRPNWEYELYPGKDRMTQSDAVLKR
jgi:hypothetical protein